MVKLVLGIACAFGASTLYSLGIALQATAARQEPAERHLRPSLFIGLLQRARWLAGTALTIIGWPLQLLALVFAPLLVVQPALALGLLVLVGIAERVLAERPGRREKVAMATIVVAVVGIAASGPRNSSGHPHAVQLTLLLVGLGVVAAVPYLLSWMGREAPAWTMLGAGLGYAWSGIATKLCEEGLRHGRLLIGLLWALSTGGASAVGALSEMSALQARPAIQVAPVVFVTQTVVPIAAAPLLLGERFPHDPLRGAALALSIAALVGAAAALARSPLLLGLMEAEASSLASETTANPREFNQPASRSSEAAAS